MCPFFIIMRSCNILETSTVHLQKFMRISWGCKLVSEINTSVWNKTISCGSGFPANPIFSALFFSRCGWVVCLSAYPIFCCLLYDATWCQKYCLLPTVIALSNVQMLGQCQLITAIADQWQAKNIWRKFVFFGPTYPTFFQDIKPEPHIFCNVLWTTEKCRPIGNVQIWLEFFSTSFRFQASAVLVNQVNMFLNWTNTMNPCQPM